LFPYTTLFRSRVEVGRVECVAGLGEAALYGAVRARAAVQLIEAPLQVRQAVGRPAVRSLGVRAFVRAAAFLALGAVQRGLRLLERVADPVQLGVERGDALRDAVCRFHTREQPGGVIVLGPCSGEPALRV